MYSSKTQLCQTESMVGTDAMTSRYMKDNSHFTQQLAHNLFSH